MDKTKFDITFWGVRGSCPTPTSYTQKFGGNTACVQVEIGEMIVIFDAGTGIIQLGNYLLAANNSIKADVFISHTHWDHIQGFPFFSPAYVNENQFTIYGEAKKNQSFTDIIKNIMKEPYFPTDWYSLQADFTFKEIAANQKIDLDSNISIHTLGLNHPGGCLGYRINYANKSCCYITDTEYKEPDYLLEQFIKETDVLIFDAQFTDKEYLPDDTTSSKVGWGHSTWQNAALLAEKMNVKKLILFHHDINRSDSELEDIEKQVQQIHKNTLVAYEGLIISL